ncbi:MAG: S53 family peptidase, partial [Actinomycetota bacterium]|nr:S53 family peptidase [Actinomycetota bacterium]
MLQLRDAAGAQALAHAISTPGSAVYRHYLTQAQWEARFAPTPAAVATAESWLRGQGFSVGATPADRLFVPAQGSAAQVETAFSTSLSYYSVKRQTVRLADSDLSVPSAISGVVSGVVGVNQHVATPAITAGASTAAAPSATSSTAEPPPPAGFRNPQPCSSYFGQKTDTTDATSLYSPYSGPLPYVICGYKPPQLRGAYGLNQQVAQGTDGRGVTVAIVDAYDSPTLLKDAQTYSSKNDPTHPLLSSHFVNHKPATVGNETLCAASGWFSEQALDVEASHAMAPGAKILYVGAHDCLDPSLLSAVNVAITSGASVVSDSWGDTLGDLLIAPSEKRAFDNTFMLAASTGVSVLFSSGDSGDNFAATGLTAPDFPTVSPFVTSVGGTALEVGSTNTRTAEVGWSTGKQLLCGPVTTPSCGSATVPSGALAFQGGGGGGTSYYYTQPTYQAPVVPTSLSLKNQALFGPTPLRVIPDISMDADAQTGMLVGLTQTFTGGVMYSQYKLGGTSLASPLLAGVIADADQAAGKSLGFLNPTLYKAYATPGAFNDIVPPASPLTSAVVRVDFANTVSKSAGYLVSLRVLDYQGVETYCDGSGNCASRNVTLT